MKARAHRAMAAGLLAFGLLQGGEARATSILSEASAGNGFLGLNLLADIPLVEDRTYLTVCAATSRTAPIDVEGQVVRPPTIYQLCAGVDHALDEHWILSVTLNGSPRSSVRVDIFSNESLYFQSDNASLGASLSAAYMSDWDSPVEWGFDIGAGATAYFFPHYWAVNLPGLRQIYPSPGRLLTARPSAGVSVNLGEHVELGLRGAYNLYGRDPLTAGRGTEDELREIGADLHTRLTASQLASITAYLGNHLEALGAGMMGVDVVSGFPSAPVWYELRPTFTYRFNSAVRAQLTYSYERYVPTQGFAHVLSTRWSVRFNDAFRAWAALALQADVPEGLEPARSGMLTLGAEYTW